MSQHLSQSEEQRQSISSPPGSSRLSAQEESGSVSEVSFPTVEQKEIREIGRKLDRRHPLVRLTEAILTGQKVPPTALLPAFQTLAEKSGAYWSEQELAAWVLGSAPLRETEKRVAAEALIPILQPTWGADRHSRFVLACRRLTLLALPIAIWIFYASDSLSPNQVGQWWKMLLVLPLALVCVLIFLPVMLSFTSAIEDNGRNRVRARAIQSLGRLGLVHGIDGIAAAAAEASGSKASSGSKRVRAAARKALPSLLSALTAEHYGKFASETPLNLCRLLTVNTVMAPLPQALKEDDPLVTPILRALTLIGDGRCIPGLRTFLRLTSSSGLKVETEALLQLLVDRQQQENNPKILLRPSSAEGIPSATLLRPAATQLDSDPASLLKPAEKPGGKKQSEAGGQQTSEETDL